VRGLIYASAIVATSSLHFLLHVDELVYRMYRMHVDNGFVLNLIQTPGGIDSMGASLATQFTFALIAMGFVLLQVGIFVTLLKIRPVRTVMNVVARLPVRLALTGVVLACIGFQFVEMGLADFNGNTSVLAASKAFPFHIELTFRGLGRRLGFTPHEGVPGQIKFRGGSLNYPLEPLVQQAGSPRYNVVWLVAESWRGDMLTPEIMPETWRFAQESTRFTSHYSGGNGTRMAMFSMFYGLYAPYWFPAKDSRRGPVLMDFFQDGGYDIRAYTSAEFSYPEFDQTLFARIDADRLVSNQSTRHEPGWQRDRKQVGKLLSSMDNRPADQPFFRFMFFESPHAPYFFPPDCVVRRPYANDINYATVNLERDISLIHNRYVNSCRNLDTQIARVLEYLCGKGLMDSTIVVITGDHGEEFMENGHWGHAMGYSEQQINIPLILRIPGRKPRTVSRMTSHLDLPPTLLRQLGVTNAPEDYCLGFDLFGPERRKFTVMGDWNTIAVMTDELKTVLPFRTGRFSFPEVWTRDDEQCSDPERFNREHGAKMILIAQQLARFLR